MVYRYESRSAAETGRLGVKLGKKLGRGDIVCLTGKLGAGKTTMIKGIARGMGVRDYVTSPSFTLINEYRGRLPLYHFDMYRLAGSGDIHELGFREYFYGEGVTVVEWADRLKGLLPDRRLDVSLRYVDGSSREITIKAPEGVKMK